MPKGLVHIIPDEAALVLFVLFDQGHIAFHAAQGVAHIVHVLAQNERFSRVFGHVGDDFGRLGVHAAFHIADVIELTAVEDALVMHQAARVIGAEEVRHSTDVLAGVALVAAGPDQHSCVVFVPFKHAAGAVDHAVPPFRQAAGHVPAGFHGAQLLPAAVAFQVGLVDHVDTVLVTQVIPQTLVGIVAGAHSIDIVFLEHGHGGVHVVRINGAALFGVPLVAVDAVEHDALAV